MDENNLDLEDEIRLGMQSVYDANPIESINAKDVKVPPKAPKKPAPKKNIDKEEQAQYARILTAFYEDYEKLPNFALIANDLKTLNEDYKSNKAWIKDTKEKLKTDKVVPTDKEWANIKSQSQALCERSEILFKNYKENNLFEVKVKNIKEMSDFFANEEILEKYKSIGLEKEFLQAKEKMDDYLSTRDEAHKLLVNAQKTYGEVKVGLKELDIERANQKARLGESVKSN